MTMNDVRDDHKSGQDQQDGQGGIVSGRVSAEQEEFLVVMVVDHDVYGRVPLTVCPRDTERHQIGDGSVLVLDRRVGGRREWTVLLVVHRDRHGVRRFFWFGLQVRPVFVRDSHEQILDLKPGRQRDERVRRDLPRRLFPIGPAVSSPGDVVKMTLEERDTRSDGAVTSVQYMVLVVITEFQRGCGRERQRQSIRVEPRTRLA
nr:TPA_asm: m118.5 ORF [Murid betaherpesvirus 1]DBA07896.1 TPA_asm: m118.5 ORF [Murid betaherpesvirus 1]